jgi:hypothetical protein
MVIGTKHRETGRQNDALFATRANIVVGRTLSEHCDSKVEG